MQLGLVWVWPESGPEALLESAAKQPACCQLVKDVNLGTHACCLLPLLACIRSLCRCMLVYLLPVQGMRCICCLCRGMQDVLYSRLQQHVTACILDRLTEYTACLELSFLLPAAEDVALTTNQNFVRDFPVAYDILFENISDQSHVPFAHNGVAYKRCLSAFCPTPGIDAVSTGCFLCNQMLSRSFQHAACTSG